MKSVEEIKVLLDFLGNLKRTNYCGDLRPKDAGRDVVVMGWVARRRDLGNLLFLDIRDRSGIVQVVFNKETHPEAHAKAEQARSEFVVAVEGKVVQRQKSNPELATGEVEILASRLHILNTAKTPPFQIEDNNKPPKRRGCVTATSICAGRDRIAISHCATKYFWKSAGPWTSLAFLKSKPPC